MYEFYLTTVKPQVVFVRFVEEIEDTKMTFQNYLTLTTEKTIVLLRKEHLLNHQEGKWKKIITKMTFRNYLTFSINRKNNFILVQRTLT